MRVIIASCSVVYTGRGDTTLAQAVRAIIIKDDGSISIHNDKSNKPLNYMGLKNVHTITEHDEFTLWAFDTTKESLQVQIHEMISDTDFSLEPGEVELVRDGTEKHLQAWLAENPEVIGEGLRFLEREFQTNAGPVDLLLENAQGKKILCEVKRTASSNAVYQIKKYLDSAREIDGFEDAEGMIVALDVRPKTVALADKRGIECVTVPADWKNFR